MSAPGLPASAPRNLGLLWTAQLLSATGDALFLPCVAWLTGRVTGRALPVGAVVALATAPYLLGPLLGPLADRVDRRRLMVASDLCRAALLLAFSGWAAAGGTTPYGALLAVAGLLGVLSVPFQPARDALLPDLVAGRGLARWNALMQTSGQVAQILGLFLGALLLAGAGDPATERSRVLGLLAWDGASFLLSALLLMLLRVPAGAAPAAARAAYWSEATEGWRDVARDPVVRGLLLLTALDNLAIMGPAIVGATLLVQTELGLPASALAAFDGAMAVGMLAGSALLVAWGRRLGLTTMLLVAMFLDGLTYLPFVALTDIRWGWLAIGFHGLFIPFLVVSRTSLLHLHVPARRRGQVFALVGTTVAGMTAVSAVLSGWAASALGVRALFLGAGVLGALCGLAGWLLLRPTLAAVERAAAARTLTTSS